MLGDDLVTLLNEHLNLIACNAVSLDGNSKEVESEVGVVELFLAKQLMQLLLIFEINVVLRVEVQL